VGWQSLRPWHRPWGGSHVLSPFWGEQGCFVWGLPGPPPPAAAPEEGVRRGAERGVTQRTAHPRRGSRRRHGRAVSGQEPPKSLQLTFWGCCRGVEDQPVPEDDAPGKEASPGGQKGCGKGGSPIPELTCPQKPLIRTPSRLFASPPGGLSFSLTPP